MDKKRLVKLVAYMVMGDGHLQQDKNRKNARFKCSHTEDHLDYIDWKQSILNEVTTSTIHTREYQDKNRIKSLDITTRQHPLFTKIRDRLYLDGKRVIDPHYLKMLDWESMSILYQDDGSLMSEKDLALYMCSYSYAELDLMKRAIKERLDMDFNIRNQGKYFKLVLPKKHISRFLEGVKPYMQPSFSYKLRTLDP